MLSATLFADAESGVIDDIVDLDRYPIDNLDSVEGLRLVRNIRTGLSDSGCVSLEGFLRPSALVEAAKQIAEQAPNAALRQGFSSVYARDDFETGMAADDPRHLQLESMLGHVTRDQIAPNTIAARLYASPTFKRFVAAAVDQARVFEYADPLAGLIATIVPPDGQLAWHYDTNEFVLSIMTQEPEGGGAFEYCPNLRKPGDENIDGLGRVLSGTGSDLVKTLSLRPGDLQIFAGRYSLHRVTPVQGPRSRHVMVFSYADRPGVIGPVDRTRAVYGRVTEAHLLAEELAANSVDGLIQ